MSFLGGQVVKLTFVRARLKVLRTGGRIGLLSFRLDLSDDSVDRSGLSERVQAVLRLIEANPSISIVDLDDRIHGQNLNFREAPDAVVNQFVPNVMLDGLSIERRTVAGGLVLGFDVEVKLDAAIGPWILDHFGWDVFCSFEQHQPALPLEEAQAEGTVQ